MKDEAAQDATAAQQEEIRHAVPLILSEAPHSSFTTGSRGTFIHQQLHVPMYISWRQHTFGFITCGFSGLLFLSLPSTV